MSGGLEPISDEQRYQLDAEVAMIQSALESLASSGVAEIEPIYRLLLSMADAQIRLGLGAVLAICAMQDRLGGGVVIDVLIHLHALLDDERLKAPTLRNQELIDVLDAAVGEIEWQRTAIARLEARIARLEGLA